MKKILALCVAVVLTVGTFGGCQKKSENNTNSAVVEFDPETTDVNPGATPEADPNAVIEVDPVATSVPSPYSDDTVIANVGEEVITVGELNYAIAVVKESCTQGFDEQALAEFWNTLIDGVNPEDYIREQALNILVDMTAFAKAARDAGITVTDEEVDELYEQSRESLNTVMEVYQVSEETLKIIYRKDMLYSKYRQDVMNTDPRFLPSDEQLKEYFAGNFYKAQHILKLTVDSTTNAPLPQAEKDAARVAIDAILQSVKDGASFEDLMNEHSQDPGLAQAPEGYVFTEGEMVPEFYEGTVALPENGVSEVIETSYGYHIIKRLPLDVDADFEANYMNVENAYVIAEETELLEELKNAHPATVDDAKVKEIPVK